MRSLSMRPATPNAPTIVVNDQDMMKVNQHLNELGIEQTIQLPQICVIGDQSTGKSSLIEALSMIKVPRDVNLIKADEASQPWNCKISLVRQFDLDGSANPAPTKKRRLGAWSELPRAENIPFTESANKDEISELILRAQAATLNPHLEPATFLTRPLRKQFKEKFSPNAVRLDIVQRELPSLSFLDLPGLVTRQDEMYLVELVKNLVAKYAQSKRSINLLTISMTSDYDTSNAFGMILTLKAESRTLAVMTKPDRCPSTDSMDGFLGMLNGTGGPRMEHGYHVVMMDPDLSLNHVAATQKEDDYFKNIDRWATLGEVYQQKLEGYSTQPSLVSEAHPRSSYDRAASARCIASASRFIAAVHCPHSPLSQTSRTHVKSFEGGGDATQYTFRREWNQAVEAFRTRIMNSRPRLKVGTKEENAQKMKAERIIRESTPRNATPHRVAISVLSDDEDMPSPVKSETKVPDRSIPVSQFHSFSLDEIRAINETHAECGADPQMFPGARKAMKQMSVQKFDIISTNFLEFTRNLMIEHITKHTEAVFHRYQHMPLYDAVMKHVYDYIEACCRQQSQKSMRMCETEKKKPYTADKATSAKEAKRYNEMLKNVRTKHRLNLCRTLHEAEQTKAKGRRTELKKIREEDLSDDEWDTEIELLATARAYHQIAASRYVDNVAQCMYVYTFPQLAEHLPRELEKFLGPERPEQYDQLVRWMSEDPERELERNRLLGERTSLLEAQKLVKETLGSEMKTGKRKARVDGDVLMGGAMTGMEEENDEPSPLKKTKVHAGDAMQPSVEDDDMDET